MVRRRLDEGETGAKKDQRKFHETVHHGMDPGQISVPSIFDFPSAEELDASLTPIGLLPLVVLPLDFQTLADAVRIAVSKGAKMLAADLHSTSEVACVCSICCPPFPQIVRDRAGACLTISGAAPPTLS